MSNNGKVNINIPAGTNLDDVLANDEVITAQGQSTVKSRSRSLSQVEEQRITWVWEGRFASGKLNMLAGDPGDGKSTITLDIAARTTTGTAWPDGKPNKAADVILLSAEDDPADTIKPRFMAAGGDPERMHVMEAVVRYDAKSDKQTESYFSLTDDIDALAELLDHTGARLVIIDPISAYLAGVDSHKNAELRSVLGPLSKLASETGVCVLCVSHLNKSSASAQYRVMGSLAFSAAARSTWVTAKDKENDVRRLLLPVKNNLAPDMGGLAYTIRSSERNADIPVVAWEKGPVTITAQQALSSETKSTKTNDAAGWLEEILIGGPVEANEIKKLAKESGIASWRTINEAKKSLDVETYCNGSPRHGGKWMWKLKDCNLKDASSTLSDSASLRNKEKTPF